MASSDPRVMPCGAPLVVSACRKAPFSSAQLSSAQRPAWQATSSTRTEQACFPSTGLVKFDPLFIARN
jgi:hypothetical protein